MNQDAFDVFEISTRLAARNKENRDLSCLEMKALECSAEQRDASVVKVLVMGTFDLVHAGHIDLFTQAKALGDHLTVGIGHDTLNRYYKGEGHPIYPCVQRKQIIQACRYVDAVYIYGADCPVGLSDEEAIAFNREAQILLVEKVGPHIFAQGIDDVALILDGYFERKGIHRVGLSRLSESEICTSYFIEKVRSLPS